nr:translesion DNA synthesis-associated protein ImuA [Caldimonas sp.]
MDAAIVPAAASSPPPPLPVAAKRQRLDAVVVRQTPETLHPDLWLGHQLGRTGAQTVATGFARLDAELPDGGWPRGALSELLLAHPGVGEMRLLAPALVAAQRDGRLVMLFDPPAALAAAALAALGFAVDELLVVETRSDSVWALEQALKSGHVGAIVAWLPQRLRAERLRRLQLAAHRHDGVAFVLREAAAAARPTAAPLRVALHAGGGDRVRLQIVKRRGPPLASPLELALPSVLSAAARRRSANGSGGKTRRLPAATFVDVA